MDAAQDAGLLTAVRAAMRLRALLCLLVLAAAAACEDEAAGERSVDEALAGLRACVAARDGPALFALYDRESRGYYERRVREWKARLQRGDPPAEVFDGTDVGPEAVQGRPLPEATADFATRHAPLFACADWFASAKVVARTADPGDPDQMRVRMRGTDGSERDLWFVREGGGWAFDHYRTDYVR